jgi:enoyl-CoA hydratase
VRADEALAIGLANRVVPDGQSLGFAQALAREIAAFPQECMRNDRRSVYEQAGTPLEAAIAREFELGLGSIASGEMHDGAASFAAGVGRHGGRVE